ncbi:hypothetical protein FHX48_002374 [Microbacterium halimionae]|uniref:Uncharacterized protein n=1 Tax=Microbacterium halimionae TaxID=1526413 RepID=A0A7W3JQU4_9MICO|nr:hypothetical protein [Microbacterium halimionae]NII94726.1 hypothetical protein [Microbacterium halimionae]
MSALLFLAAMLVFALGLPSGGSVTRRRPHGA